MWRRPLLEVRNLRTGKNILPQLKGYWTSVAVEENDGQESDTAEITCLYRPGLTLPAKGDEYEIFMGWHDEGLILQGRYTVQKFSRRGDPESGEFLVIQLRAADFIDKLKAEGTQHYDADTTFGDLMRDLANQTGAGLEIDPELAKKKLGYRLRYQQSPIDFANEVAEDIGGTVRPAGGKLIATKRGGGKSASGRNLERIAIKYNRTMGYDIEIEPRPQVGHIAAAWQDPDTGRRKMVKEPTGRDGPIRILDMPFLSENEAREAVKSAAFEAGNATGSGYFDCPGLPRARAGAFVNVTGYGDGIDGEWKAESVRKMIAAKDAFLTTVTVTAGNKEKGKGGSSAPGPNDNLLPQ